MINVSATQLTSTQPKGASLFDAAALPNNAYWEAFSSYQTPRDHWQGIIAALDTLGPQALKQRQIRVRRMRHEDGATYNPFNDPSGKGIPYALDVIPLIITAAEWADLEAGLIQRAALLEQILADVYGPQELMHCGRLPSELIFANPHFLRSCHGIQPSGNRFLPFYAADLYRGTDGRFKVLRDYGGSPTGLGYSLENRIVISRILSQLYHQTQIRRLAPFFQTFHRSLMERTSRRGEDPGIVLLSPGPDSQIYFEHALLSRYLGYQLVEGQDLTVRNGEVFLKKLAGLEPVEVIVRHIADDDSDPFALRKVTSTGVAGLIQVMREGNIDIVNPIGSGFVDTPVLALFLPDLCRQLTGRELLLENHPAWWCGDNAGLNHVLANRDHLPLTPALDRTRHCSVEEDQTAAVQATPYAYMAQAPVIPAAAPAWSGQAVCSRNVLLRVFACATEDGFAIMPGGLAITAHDTDTLLNGALEQQQSKDVWVVSNQPVEPFSLMRGLQTVSEFKRGGDLPSRVADNLLWLGRYLERAEGLIRLLRCLYRRLSGEARLDDIPELAFLLTLLTTQNHIPKTEGGVIEIPRFRELSAMLAVALYPKERPESVAAMLIRVQDTARKVRDRLSLDSWRVINRLEEFGETSAGDPLELLDNTLFTLSAFSGLAMESMTRGLGWRFMDIGRRVERALHQTGLIRTALSNICSESQTTMEALLEVSDSLMTYRARYRTIFQLAPVLDLLLVDESNPKSLAFQFSRLADHVEHLPRRGERRFAGPEERLTLEMLTAARLLDLADVTCAEPRPDADSLTAFFETMEARLTDFAQQISAHYLSRVPTTPHYSMLTGDRRI